MLRWRDMALTTPLHDAIAAFLIACDASNKSQRTKRWYRANLAEFTSWLRANGAAQTLASLEPGLVNAYLVHRKLRTTRYGRRPSASALRADAMTLKVFANWLAAEELLADQRGASVLRRRPAPPALRRLRPAATSRTSSSPGSSIPPNRASAPWPSSSPAAASA